MYNYSPQTCLIKDIDGKIYNIIDLWQGKKIPVDLTTIQYSYAPKSCLVQNVDGTNVNVIDTILAVANGSGSGTSSLEEVIQARGKYSTLGERLDKDNEKVYETINSKDFIPFTGENITVEHSKVGFTKDMQVEGMTYQNLWNGKVGTNCVKLIKPLTNYKIIICNCTKGSPQLNGKWMGLDSGGDFLVKPTDNTETYYEISKTSPANANGMSLYFTSGGYVDDELKILILEGSTSIASPYFEGIKSVGEKENKISILSNGKNILPPLKNYSTITGFNLNNLLKNGVQYTVTNNNNQLVKIAESKDAETYLGQSSSGKFTFTFDNSKQQNLYVWKKYEGQVIELFTNENIDFVMIEEGVGSIFEPYKSDKKEILIPFEDGLKGLPNRVKDLIFNKEDGYYVKQKINKKIFVGNVEEGCKFITNYGTVSRFDLELANIKPSSDIMCDKFIKGVITTPDLECINVHGVSKFIQIQIKSDKLETQDVEGFKKWLQANPVEVYYELAEPIEHKITDLNSINLETFKDMTYVSSENEIQPNLNFKAPVDVQATISTLRENNAQLSNELEVKTQELQEKDKELANEDDLLTAKDLDMDFRIFELEEQLTPEIAKLSMSHNSPYPMIKRCIEKGLYEKEDMLYKMNRYLHGKRLTQEEYDELKLMMG